MPPYMPYNAAEGQPFLRQLLQMRAVCKQTHAASMYNQEAAALLLPEQVDMPDTAGNLSDQLQRMALLAAAVAELQESKSYMLQGLQRISTSRIKALNAALHTLYQVGAGNPGFTSLSATQAQDD